MDQTTNPLERFFDLKDQDFQLTPFDHQQKYFTLQHLHNNEHHYEDKNQDKNQFFISSPNPFLKQYPNFSNFNLTPQKHNKNNRNRSFIQKKLNFEDMQMQSPIKSFTFQKYNEQNNYQNQDDTKKQSFFQQEDEEEQSDLQHTSSNKNKPSNVLYKTKYSTQKMKRTKQSKGLKGLSENVYEIVKQQGITSYNKVATILIQQMKQNSKIYGHIFDGRDQQNIKRRVYDALNVLISAQVLKKQNKSVAINKQLFTDSIFSRGLEQKKPKNIKRQIEDIKNLLQEQIKLKKFTIQQKKEMINKLHRKKKKIQSFIKRNIKIDHEVPLQIKNQPQNKEEIHKIKFPFVCMCINSNFRTKINYTITNSHNIENRMMISSRQVWEKQNSSTQDSFTLSHQNQNIPAEQTSIAIHIKTDHWNIYGDLDFVMEGNYDHVQNIDDYLVKSQIQNLCLHQNSNQKLLKGDEIQHKTIGKKGKCKKQSKTKVQNSRVKFP